MKMAKETDRVRQLDRLSSRPNLPLREQASEPLNQILELNQLQTLSQAHLPKVSQVVKVRHWEEGCSRKPTLLA